MANVKETVVLLLIALAGAVAGWLARARYWFFPDNMTKADGTPDPRAGKFDLRSMLTDLATLGAITFIAGGIGVAMNLHPLVVALLSTLSTYIGMTWVGQIAKDALTRKAEALIGSIEK